MKTLDEERMKLLLKDSISPLPLHKILILRGLLGEMEDARLIDHERLALARTAVANASNLHFGPEVGVGTPKHDARVVGAWLDNIRAMALDLREVSGNRSVSSEVLDADAREVGDLLEPGSIDAVITSPPYPNEKDYTRTTRLESVLLGFISSKADLRTMKRKMIRSNTRGVYQEDNDDQAIAGFQTIDRIARAIEDRRIELGKTSGFERLYARTTKLYFGGMARHLAELRTVLRPGARLAYVVGDQASYLRVMIRTGQLLAEIAQSLGYEVESIDLFRTRLATATRAQLREEVVCLCWPGTQSRRSHRPLGTGVKRRPDQGLRRKTPQTCSTRGIDRGGPEGIWREEVRVSTSAPDVSGYVVHRAFLPDGAFRPRRARIVSQEIPRKHLKQSLTYANL
jgi:hypothetical protein